MLSEEIRSSFVVIHKKYMKKSRISLKVSGRASQRPHGGMWWWYFNAQQAEYVNTCV